MSYIPFREPRLVTERELGERYARWYADQDIARLRRKRRQTHKLLMAARKEIARLRALTNG